MEKTALETKPHFMILDGLRGVAAILILIFHVFETYTIGTDKPLLVGHGYLAVDFFFGLSGFVIGFAYDDRWNRMSLRSFLKRRIIRLHPMVVLGMVIGAVFFYFGSSFSPEGEVSKAFHLIADTPVWKMLFYMILGMFLIPTPPSIDIRGWREMYTLDAPTWSLFFEYIAYILYALIVRKFSKIALSILVFLSACSTIYLMLTQGDVIGGWEFTENHLYIGFTRLFYPFFSGLLLYRLGRLIRIKNAFPLCCLLLVILLALPRIGGDEVWKNGIYEGLAILVAFPLIILTGAGGEIKNKTSEKWCRFLGDISFPLYIVHYPLIYVFTGYVTDNNYSFAETWPEALLVFNGSILIAYAALKWYDIPIRKWLTKKF